MASNEDQLNDLVNGGLWGMPNFSSLIKSVEDERGKLQKVIGELPGYWKGQSGEILVETLKWHVARLDAFAEFLHEGQQQVTGNGKFSCSVNSDNADRIEQAQAAIDRLPSSLFPTHVLDQIQAGAKVVEVHGVGVIDVAAQGVGWVAGALSSNRERAAAKELSAISASIEARAIALSGREFSFDIEKPVPPPPIKRRSDHDGSEGPWVPPTGRPPGFPTGPPYGPPTSPPTGPPTGPPIGPPTGPPYGPPTDPPTGPPTGPPTEPPTGPLTTPPPGTNPPGVLDPTDPRDEPRGPSVDSELDGGRSGFDVRSGLGAAGLGGAGLAAGAKLASGAGGLGGLGAGGIGGAGVGGVGGLAGTTGAGAAGGAAAGGSGSGSTANSGKGAGSGRPGMMMGGQGGGAAEKKGGQNRLGYVAPKFEDDYEENMPHPSARAGRRGE